jgi:sugar phosphate permease
MTQTNTSGANAAQDGIADSTSSKPTRVRWWVLFLISLLYLISYMDRGNISVAAPEIAREFHLSKTVMGLILASFTWAYAVGQVPVGWLGDRFGPKKVLTLIGYGIGLAPILNGLAVGASSLYGARVFLGLAESGAFPVASRGMQMWFARSERGRIQGITHLFSRAAVAITPGIAAAIMLAFGWRTIFYVFGTFGILWAIVFSILYRNNPEEHKGVNQAELAHIRGLNADGSIKVMSATRPRVPWRMILSAPNMWYIAVGWSCFFFGSNFYLTWYPTYLREYRHMSLKVLGLLGALPLIAGMLGDVVGGAVSDAILEKTGNAKLARRIVAAPGFVLAGVFVIPAALTNSPLVSVLCLAASFFSLEVVLGVAWAVCMDVGGQYSGTVTGIMNMAGALAASMTAVVYGALFDRGMWIAPFFVTAGVMLMGALIWIFLINPERSVVGGSA